MTNDYISRADAMAVAQYSKDPVEGIRNLPGVQFIRCAECQYSRELNRADHVENKYVEGCVWCMERSDGVFRNGGCSEGLPRKENGDAQG